MIRTTALLALAFALAAPAARAHDWYPSECCGGYDCGPADMTTVAGATYYAGKSVSPMAVPKMVTTVDVHYSAPLRAEHNEHEIAVVPDNLPRRDSPDNKVHACIRYGAVVCVWVPPSN